MSEKQERRLSHYVGRAWMKFFGWDVEGWEFLEAKKAVVIAAPHTSNWDLPFTLATAYVMDLDFRWLGKHTLFQGTFGPFFHWLGGIPVDRSGRHNLVQQAVEIMNKHDRLLLIVPPEGTRSRASRWKTGFYWIAEGAKVPIMLGFLDFGRKRSGVLGLVYPTGDIQKDIEQIRAMYAPVKGKHPERQGSITLGDDARADAAAVPPANAAAAMG